MEAATASHPHEMPQTGGALTRVAISATLHCLTGCAIGEVLGMVIGTALGFSELGTVALAVSLAFVFGYALTSLPLLRAGMAMSVVIPIALASDTLSIATMEIVDNALMLSIPGAMEAGVGSILFWGSLSFALVIAGTIAVPVNRWLIARGKGHAVVHETGIHGGPSPRTVGIAAAVAFVFGSSVLIAEIANGSTDSAGHETMSGQAPVHGEQAGGGHDQEPSAAAVRGLSASAGGLTLELDRTELPRDTRSTLSFSAQTSTSATRTPRGSARPTRTPTGCCANTFRKAPTCRSTPLSTSTPLQPSSTTDHANASRSPSRSRSSDRYCCDDRQNPPTADRAQIDRASGPCLSPDAARRGPARSR